MKKTSWPAVTTAVLVGVLAAVHVGKLPPALPLIRADLGFGLVEGGFVISLFSLVGMTLAVFLGGLADRLGRQALIILGFAALISGGVLGALAESLPMMMASRLIEGVGFISTSVALPAVVFAAAAQRDQAFVLGLWSVYTPLGMALAMLVSPLALAAIGWRGLWWAIIVLCPFAAAAVLRSMRGLHLPPATAVPFLTIAKGALTCRGFLLNALAFLGYAFQWVTLMVWLPTFLTEGLNTDLETAALITALVVLVNVAGCLLGGWLLRHGAAARSLVVVGSLVMGISAIGIFLPVLTGHLRIALCVAFSFLGGLIPPSLFNTVPRIAPAPYLVGAGNGLMMQGSALGQFIGAPLVAYAVARAGGDWAYALIPMLGGCTVTIMAALLLYRATPTR